MGWGRAEEAAFLTQAHLPDHSSRRPQRGTWAPRGTDVSCAPSGKPRGLQETSSTLNDFKASSSRGCHPQPENANCGHSKMGQRPDWLVKVTLSVRRAGQFREVAMDIIGSVSVLWDLEAPR